MKSEGDEIKSKHASKRDRTLTQIQLHRNSCHYPLINYPDPQDMSENDSDSMESSKPLSETMIIKPDISRPKRKINNPWNVNDVSDFLKYCCPECDFTDQNLPQFTDHALENHVLSNILFNNTSHQEDSEIKSEHKDDIDYKSEYPGMEIKDEPMEYGKAIDIYIYDYLDKILLCNMAN